MSNDSWEYVCEEKELEEDSVCRFDNAQRSFAVYNSEGEFYATDGYCTHEQQHLEDGLVMDGIIECPLHMGQFDIETGDALSGPVCINLKTYAVKIDSGKIYIKI